MHQACGNVQYMLNMDLGSHGCFANRARLPAKSAYCTFPFFLLSLKGSCRCYFAIGLSNIILYVNVTTFKSSFPRKSVGVYCSAEMLVILTHH